jgi:hypothetical protein
MSMMPSGINEVGLCSERMDSKRRDQIYREFFRKMQ